jgi:hypothetical protein
MAEAQKISLYSIAGQLLRRFLIDLPYRPSVASPLLNSSQAWSLLEFICWTDADVTEDLKNTSDDAIPNYLNSLKFKQSHTLSDVRLALGYLAFAISAATFYWDYKLGFESTKYYTAAAVAVYACLNGALTFWIWGVEKGKIYVGTSPNGDKASLSPNDMLLIITN